jgi:transcriptional regulator with XRE-family HTH domain
MKRNRKPSGRVASKGFPNPIDVHVGARIRRRRTLLGISQTTLADAIGLTFQQVQKYEKGSNRVSSSRLVDVANVLDVSIPYCSNKVICSLLWTCDTAVQNGVFLSRELDVLGLPSEAVHYVRSVPTSDTCTGRSRGRGSTLCGPSTSAVRMTAMGVEAVWKRAVPGRA